MPPRYAATVSCPSCGTRFQAPIEQILDVRVDPSVRNRVMGGAINVAVCPSCGTGGALGLPFIYHDPEKEVALLYLPIESGANEVERQQAAGRLTRQLMDAMAPEERKGYLLQPETFINLETLVKRVLEIEGVSEEDMARSQHQRELLGTLLEAEEETWGSLVAEHASLVDEGLFAFIEYVIQLAGASGAGTQQAEKLEALHTFLVEETETGRLLRERSDVIRQFAEDPNRDTLLEALSKAPDEQTIDLLVQNGVSLMDYAFFQKLNQRIEEASPDEASALQRLRRGILDRRDALVEQSDDVVRERAQLLEKLLMTQDPKRMASSHLSELDELFFGVLGVQLQDAQQSQDKQAVAALQRVAATVNEVIEGTMPPEIALTRRLMAAPSDEQLEAQLRTVRKMLTPEFLQFLEALESSMREEGQEDAADRVVTIRAKAREIAPAPADGDGGGAPVAGPAARPAEQRDGPGASEERTASGLIIAKR